MAKHCGVRRFPFLPLDPLLGTYGEVITIFAMSLGVDASPRPRKENTVFNPVSNGLENAGKMVDTFHKLLGVEGTRNSSSVPRLEMEELSLNT